MSQQENVLLLGMVYAHRAQTPKRGQEFRDRVRCEAVEKSGYHVYTLDNKHDGLGIKEHCTGNFCDSRRMLKSMKSKWPENPKFNHIILDYFFSPEGWARERWSTSFFSDTLPTLAKENFLTADGQIWLPNLTCITERLEESSEAINKHFKLRLVSAKDVLKNPLYRATELVERELLTCPDKLTNETQLRPLLALSEYPFYVLEVLHEGEKGGFVMKEQEVPSTPQKKPVKRSRKNMVETVECDVSPLKKDIRALRFD